MCCGARGGGGGALRVNPPRAGPGAALRTCRMILLSFLYPILGAVLRSLLSARALRFRVPLTPCVFVYRPGA